MKKDKPLHPDRRRRAGAEIEPGAILRKAGVSAGIIDRRDRTVVLYDDDEFKKVAKFLGCGLTSVTTGFLRHGWKWEKIRG